MARQSNVLLVGGGSFGSAIRSVVSRHLQCTILSAPSIREAVELLEGPRPRIDFFVCGDSGQSAVQIKSLLSLCDGAPGVIFSDVSAIVESPDLSQHPDLFLLRSTWAERELGGILGRLCSAGYFDSLPEEDFVRFSPKALVDSAPLKADVFVRLASNRFVKIWRRNDYTTADEVKAAVAERRAQEFYVRAAECREVLDKRSGALDRLLAAPAVSASDVEQVEAASIEALEIVSDVVSRLGFTPEIQAMAKRVAELVIKVIGEDLDLSKILVRFNRQAGGYIASHSVMLAEVACAIAYRIGWNSSGTYTKLSLAAVLHDITFDRGELARVRDLGARPGSERGIETLSAEHVEAIRMHPMKAAEYALSFKEFPPDVDSILRQHHERPDGSGFPRGLFHQKITPLSALFIIAHDLLDEFLAAPGGGADVLLDRFLADRKDEYSVGNFRKIRFALRHAKPV